VAARWPTTLSGGAAAVNTPFFLIFLALSLLLPSLYTFLTLKFPTPSPKHLDLKRKFEKKKNFYTFYESGWLGVKTGGACTVLLTLFWRLIHKRFAVGLTTVVAFVRFTIRVGSVLFCDVGVVQFFGPFSVCFAGIYREGLRL